MTFLEMKSEFESLIGQFAEYELLELRYEPYAFGSGLAAYRLKGRTIMVLYDGKEFKVKLLMGTNHMKYPSNIEKEIFYDSYSELVKKLPDILTSNFP